MDRRYICEDCEVKWFVPDHDEVQADPGECSACGGPLVPFEPGDAPTSDGASRPGASFT